MLKGLFRYGFESLERTCRADNLRRSTGTRMRGVFNSQLGKKPNLAKDGSLASIPNARFVSM